MDEARHLGDRTAACAAVALTLCVCVTGCHDSSAQVGASETEVQEPGEPGPPPAVAPQERIEFPPPPLSEDSFPCSECHDPELLPVRTKPRQMRMAHQEIVLEHDSENRWCLDCHDAEDRDKLRLASGKLIDFEESHLLCGQCHGDKHRDWRAGVHGRRSGKWDGDKTYLLCVHCHTSHSPKFEPLEPEPAPIRPRRTR